MIKSIYFCDKCGSPIPEGEVTKLDVYDVVPLNPIGNVHICPDCFKALFGTMKISKDREKARRRR